jgi:hypothetical protein
MSMEMLLRRMKVGNVTVHGFRSSFRDWAAEETPFAREIAEAALATTWEMQPSARTDEAMPLRDVASSCSRGQRLLLHPTSGCPQARS